MSRASQPKAQTDPTCQDQPHSRVALFGMPLDLGVARRDILARMSSGSLLLSYLNPYAYSIARTHRGYAADLGRFDLVVCDGIGVQVAVKSVFNLTTPVISLDYSGIACDYLQWAARRKLNLCLVGGEPEIALAAAAKIDRKFPGFEKVSAFGGYGESRDAGRDFILASQPGLVLAGLGMGQQESWLLDLIDSGWSGVGICVGGFFDKIARPQLQYPRWAERTRLRFLGRLLKEPGRLSRRYFIDYQPFIKMYIKHLVSHR